MSLALTDTNQSSRSTELLRAVMRLSTLALSAVAIAANFTDYGPLIPLLQRELRITSGATGLLSTLLYVGIGLSYLPGGGSRTATERAACSSGPCSWSRRVDAFCR
jgi:cyanate permease